MTAMLFTFTTRTIEIYVFKIRGELRAFQTIQWSERKHLGRKIRKKDFNVIAEYFIISFVVKRIIKRNNNISIKLWAAL